MIGDPITSIDYAEDIPLAEEEILRVMAENEEFDDVTSEQPPASINSLGQRDPR